MSYAVASPFVTFCGRDGTPLDDGYIYIGSANQNPETNPISVYWDKEMTQPAAQPVRTLGGYPSRYGTPANLYVAGDFSITVRDNKKGFVFTKPTSDALNLALSGASGAGMVGFLQRGTGAVLSNLQSKAQRVFDLFDFMTEAQIADVQSTNPALDVSGAIQNALNACYALGGGIVQAPPGRYRLTSRITIPQWVLLRGADWLPDPSNGAQVFMTSLYIDWGATLDQHAVEMSHSSGIEGFTFYYPGQAAKTASTPVAFGFSISTPTTGGVCDNIHVKNITLYNSYKGIRLNNGGRWNVENVQGDPLYYGFTASNCLDVCYMRKVHFWPFYTQDAALQTWVRNNGIAFEFWRIDQLFADDLFGFDYQICYRCMDQLWASFSNILSDKARYPFFASATANVNVSNFVFIPFDSTPAISVLANAASVRFVNGHIFDTGAVGAQIDDTSIVQFSNVKFDCKHSCVVVTSTSSDVYLDNCVWKVPPFGGYNVRINGERLPNDNTAIALPAPLLNPTPITGGYQFDLSTAGTKVLQYETTYISQRNSLFTLEFDYNLVGTPTTWYFQITVQTDVGTNVQVSFTPTAPFILNLSYGLSTRRIRVPIFINHGRFKQVLNIVAQPTIAVPGASLNITNIALYEQDNKYTTDAQVSNLMRNGYNLDAYNMGQTLFAKGKNRIVLTQSEPGIGRATEVPTYGTWAQGDEVRTYSPASAGYIGYVCTVAGTPGTWKGFGLIA